MADEVENCCGTESCSCGEGSTCKSEPVKASTYWEFLDELEATMKAFLCEARAGDINKQAALRARKMSLIVGKSLKEYREVSVAHDKTHGRKKKAEVELSKEIASC